MKYRLQKCAPEIGWGVLYWPDEKRCGHAEFFASRLRALLFILYLKVAG